MPPSRQQDNPWLEHLSETFSFIQNNGDFDEITSSDGAGNLNIDPKKVVSNFFSKLAELKKKRSVTELNIPLLEIPIFDEQNERINEKLAEKHRATFLIGGRMQFRDGKLTYYSFSVCLVFATLDHSRPHPPAKSLNIDSCCLAACRDNKRIIRRIHFDYQPVDHPQRRFHVQIGGLFPNHERSYQNLHYCSEYFLERPRFPYGKIDFAKLFDFMIREFDTPLKKWREDPQWNKLVKRSQDLLDTLENN